jgi:hypothetical protein
MQEAGSKPPKLNSGKHKNSQRLTQVIKTEPKVKKGSLKWKYIDPLRQGQRLDTTKTKQYQLPNGNDLSSPWTNATIPPSKCYQLSTNRSNRFPKPVPPVSHAQDQNRFHRFPNRPDRFTYTDCSKPKNDRGDRETRPITNHDRRRKRRVCGVTRREYTSIRGSMVGGTRVGDPLGAHRWCQPHGAEGNFVTPIMKFGWGPRWKKRTVVDLNGGFILQVPYILGLKKDILSRSQFSVSRSGQHIFFKPQDDFKWKKFELQSCRSRQKLQVSYKVYLHPSSWKKLRLFENRLTQSTVGHSSWPLPPWGVAVGV